MRLLIVTVAVLGFVLFSSNLLAQAAEGETRGIAPAPDIPRFERFLTERDVLNYIQATTEIEQTHKETLGSLQARFEASAEVAVPLDASGYVAVNRHTYNDLATLDEKEFLDSVYYTAGFSRIGNWPETSDRIFSAYLKLQAERGVYDLLNSLSDVLLARLPAKQVAEIRRTKMMMLAAVELTSDIDLAIVRPHLSALEIAMDDEMGKQSGPMNGLVR